MFHILERGLEKFGVSAETYNYQRVTPKNQKPFRSRDDAVDWIRRDGNDDAAYIIVEEDTFVAVSKPVTLEIVPYK